MKVRESDGVRFGPFEFDAANRLLYRDGVELWLPPRAIGVLACLLTRAGQVVSKQDLLDEVWKDANVTETSLTEAISLLRQTLRDDPQRPTFIQTIPRRGYRFLVAATTAQQPSAPPAAGLTALSPASLAGALADGRAADGTAGNLRLTDADSLTRTTGAGAAADAVWPAWLSWVLLLVSLGALLIVSITVSRQPSLRVRPVVRFELDLPAGLTLDAGAPVALTRNGQRIAFAASRADGVRQLFVRDLDQLEPAALADTAGATAPFFSPDGRWVGFFADGKLKKLALEAAGRVIPLCDAPHPFGATWIDDGTIVFAGSWSGGLQRVSADGGVPTPLTTPDAASGEVRHAWPDLVPESNAVLFAGLPPGGAPEASRVAVVSLTTGEVRTLVEAATFPRFLSTGHLLYARAKAIFAAPVDASTFELLGPTIPVLDNVRIDPPIGAAHFTVAQAGSLVFTPADDGDAADAFRWLDRTDTFLLPFSARAIRAFSVSPDATRVAAAVGDDHRTDIWLQDLATGKTTRLTTSGQNLEPVWSPAASGSDGSRVIFSGRRESSAGGGAFNLYAKDLTLPSATATRLTDSAHNQFPCSISAAGIVFVDQSPDAGADLWLLPAAGGPPRPLVRTPDDETFGAFSPDGRWLAYQTFLHGAWTLMLRATATEEAAPMLLGRSDGGRIEWADADDLYFTRDDQVMTLKLSHPQEAPRPVAGVRGPHAFARAARDGRLLLMTPPQASQPARSHVEMVLEWARELSARVPVRTPPPRPLR